MPEPKPTVAGGEWTVPRFWAFIRSNLRLASRKWPPINQCLRDARRGYNGPNKRQKWEYLCENCDGWFMRKRVQVDHITPVGSLKSHDDLKPFVLNLFCEKEHLRVLCKECHKILTS